MFSFISYYYYRIKDWMYPPNKKMIEYTNFKYEPLLEEL